MGPWADVIIAVAGVVATFLAVMAFSGLVQTVDGLTAQCAGCGKTTLLPMPAGRQDCWQCRHPAVHAPHLRIPHLGGR